MKQLELQIQPLNNSFIEPQYSSDEASGIDIYACIDEDITIEPLERVLISTGFAMALPKGYEAQIRPRSGLALKYGLTILNSPGTIDSDYRGEVKILLINLGQQAYTIEKKSRIAQMVIQEVYRASISIQLKLSDSNRGEGGFGSTGVK